MNLTEVFLKKDWLVAVKLTEVFLKKRMTGCCENNKRIPRKKNGWSMYKQLKCSEKQMAGRCEINRSILFLEKRMANCCKINRSSLKKRIADDCENT